MNPGDIVQMTSFTHCQPGMRVSFKAPSGRVAVFMLLGDADKKDPDSFDCFAALKEIGWVPEESK